MAAVAAVAAGVAAVVAKSTNTASAVPASLGLFIKPRVALIAGPNSPISIVISASMVPASRPNVPNIPITVFGILVLILLAPTSLMAHSGLLLPAGRKNTVHLGGATGSPLIPATVPSVGLRIKPAASALANGSDPIKWTTTAPGTKPSKPTRRPMSLIIPAPLSPLLYLITSGGFVMDPV